MRREGGGGGGGRYYETLCVLCSDKYVRDVVSLTLIRVWCYSFCHFIN